jgi:hypothetical protein
LAGFGGGNNPPYVEMPYAKWITNVHWSDEGGVCGGSATATGAGPFPFGGVAGYEGTGDLSGGTFPKFLHGGGCRENQPWSIVAQVTLAMQLGPFHEDNENFTKDANYSATFFLYKLVESDGLPVLGPVLASTSVSGSLHNDSTSQPGAPGSTVFGEVTGAMSASGNGTTAFAFDFTYTTSPAGKFNVGGGPSIGAIVIVNSP